MQSWEIILVHFQKSPFRRLKRPLLPAHADNQIWKRPPHLNFARLFNCLQTIASNIQHQTGFLKALMKDGGFFNEMATN